MHQADVVVIVAAASAVVDRTIIPDHQIARSPMMAVAEFGLSLVNEQIVKQRLAIRAIQALNPDGKTRRQI